jgi:hypothetical protein
MTKVLLVAAAATVVAAVLAFAGGGPASSSAGDPGIARGAALGKIKPAKIVITSGGTTTTRTLPFISDGTIVAAQQALGVLAGDERAEGADAVGGDIDLDGAGGGGSTTTGSGPAHSLGCGGRTSAGNVRVNQDCTFRRQAEEEIVYNPADPNNLVAGQNDSRVGFNQCGTDFSTNNGKNWGDELPPFRQKVNNPAAEEPTPADPNRHTIAGGEGTLHTYDAGSDPALAMDSRGSAFFSCVAFDVFSNASLLYVTQSPLGAEGSFYYNIGMFGRNFVVAEDNNGLIFHDKNFIAADIYPSSPNRDNVYVTWTVFHFTTTGDYERSPIFGSMSTNHGLTWSTPEEISGTSDTLCFFGNFFDPTQPEHACNFDQGSDPVVLPNGDLAVVWNNGNTPAGNPNGQQLGVLCHPTGSSPAGTAHLNCGSPSKVGDDVITGEPQCNFGRGPEECIPGAFIRTNDFPRIVTENTQNNHLYVVWQDYRNHEYDIQLAVSTDGGVTWTERGTVNPDRGLDHYFPAVDQSPQGNDRVGVSYYRTERIPNENTTPSGGFAPGQPGVQTSNSDYVLAGGTRAETPYDFKVISPVFPPPDGIQAGFNGDYSGLVINKGTDAHPIWSDTRNVDPYAPTNGVVNDEDVFTDNVGLPNGRGKAGTGRIGRR